MHVKILASLFNQQTNSFMLSFILNGKKRTKSFLNYISHFCECHERLSVVILRLYKVIEIFYFDSENFYQWKWFIAYCYSFSIDDFSPLPPTVHFGRVGWKSDEKFSLTCCWQASPKFCLKDRSNSS